VFNSDTAYITQLKQQK